MSCLYYRDNALYVENIALETIAERYGTPCYVYSRAAIESNWRAFHDALSRIPHRICYAVKANSNIAILQLLARLGSGFDIVSLGELKRVIEACGQPDKIIYSGVCKSETEIKAAIQRKIYCINVESDMEIDRIQSIAAQLQTTVDIAIRINPNVDAMTHAHISTGMKENKFGIDITDVIAICRKITTMPSIRLIGIACHIGSQIVELQPFLTAIDRLLAVYDELQTMGISLKHINIGGGLGITYQDEAPPSIQQYIQALEEKIRHYPIEIILEPGRAIVGNAGLLLTRVEYLKHTSEKNFALVDAGMNDFMRPALYNAWQNIVPVIRRHENVKQYDVAGPVCESSDFLGKNRELAVKAGDLLAIDTTGAYGFSMSSNYNSRCRPAEVLVDGDHTHLIRRRESIDDLFSLETMI